ncbi:MAG: bifunctional [glutamine synthetase] adenylyltransferase/[glutamine synthetase]-adenylyl-L-tyrosine phosphorylase, partial [Nitriliruptorales bacterium]
GVLGGVVAALLREAAEAGRLPIRFCVVGMGKLGGEELNYVSDVDVVFVHAPGDGGDEAGAREEARRVCVALLQILNASTTMGRAYEIDPTLRPEGRDGLLSRTPESFSAYWERWAETWEFQAMLKARPVCGDLALGEEFLRRAEPFVFPDRLDPAVVAEIRAMKGRVEEKAEVVREGERQLKLGPGGIRDIEFAVQLLQLVHGRADRTLRERGTLPALAALAAGGYVAEEDAEEFAATYRTLRDVEHRLQLARERRTHTLPDDPGRLERLARSLGYEPAGEVPAREPFLRHLRAVQGRVRDLHAKLFYRPLLEVHAAVPASDAELVGGEPAGGLEEQAALTRVQALGFHDGRAVLRDVGALTGGLTRRAAVLRGVLPAFLHGLMDTPDPDGGLRALRDLVESQQDDTALIAALRDQPPTVPLLARMLGTSRVVAELLASVPQGVGWITDPDAREAPRTADELIRAALGLLGWQDGLVAREGALRRFKRRELVRVVVRDLAGTADVASVAVELAALGDACLEAGLTAVLDEVDPDRDGPARIAVVALGKLGGRELHYVSDLDVVFVHETVDGAAEDVAARFAIEVAERVLQSLSGVTAEGTAFEVDPELRPEGRSGPLSRSLGSCRTYYDRWAETWERFALLKARHVAGDVDLGRGFVALAREHAYPGGTDDAGATELRRMKARIERERVPQRVDARRHLKLGPGGLTDVEWTVQLLQRLHGHREPLARTTSTLTAIDGLHDAGILDGRDAGWLRDGYRLLARARNRLYLLRRRDVDVLPSSDEELERLARSLDYGRGGRQAFEADYLRAIRRIRQVTERLFYGT